MSSCRSLWTDAMIGIADTMNWSLLCQWTGRHELMPTYVVNSMNWSGQWTSLVVVVNWSGRCRERTGRRELMPPVASCDELVVMSLTSSLAACWCRRKWECEWSTSNIPHWQQQQRPEYLQRTFMFHYPVQPNKAFSEPSSYSSLSDMISMREWEVWVQYTTPKAITETTNKYHTHVI